MKKRVLALCPPVSSPLTPSRWFPGNDVTTKPDLYYLTNACAIDSSALLPRRRRWAVSRS